MDFFLYIWYIIVDVGDMAIILSCMLMEGLYTILKVALTDDEIELINELTACPPRQTRIKEEESRLNQMGGFTDLHSADNNVAPKKRVSKNKTCKCDKPVATKRSSLNAPTDSKDQKPCGPEKVKNSGSNSNEPYKAGEPDVLMHKSSETNATTRTTNVNLPTISQSVTKKNSKLENVQGPGVLENTISQTDAPITTQPTKINATSSHYQSVAQVNSESTYGDENQELKEPDSHCCHLCFSCCFSRDD